MRDESDFIWFLKLKERNFSFYGAREQMYNYYMLIPSILPIPTFGGFLLQSLWVKNFISHM